MSELLSADAVHLRAGGRVSDLAFGVAAFLGSSLVFVVQPMIAKQLLPTLGGAPAVWTTCVLFFQACLLVGYAWAHLGPRVMGDRAHAVVHAALLVGACASLPIGIAQGWRPRDDVGPATNVLLALAGSVGLPLCVLCATSPLIQRWHVAINPHAGDRVYRFYAIGNVASLLVLLAYPLAIEPTSTVREQLVGWSWLFAVLTCLLIGGAVLRLRTRADTQAAVAASHAQGSRTVAGWIFLSAVPCSLMLGVTSYLTSDVAAVPFLWVVPLALYLGAFSLAFAGLAPHRFVWRCLGPGLAFSCLLLVGLFWSGMTVPLAIALRAGAFFLLAWSCLSALYAMRPASAALTGYYLWIAVGGVIGGAFNSLLAPRLFNTTVEYPLALLLAAAFCYVWPIRSTKRIELAAAPAAIDVTPLHRPDHLFGVVTVMVALAAGAGYAISETRVHIDINLAGMIALLVVPVLLCWASRSWPLGSGIAAAVLAASVLVLSFGGPASMVARRSFFGVHRVGVAPTEPFLQLTHGTTVHGQQSYDVMSGRTIRPELPLTYYHREGPLGAVLSASRPQHIGVVGLGAGSIAAYAGSGQRLTYYEIDPVVIDLAAGIGPFTYLQGARERGAVVDIVEGDARLTLARDDRTFDLLVLDAFSGDAIPAHLLTREAFALYGRRLAERGTLALHVSNRYLDLSKVVAAGGAGVGPHALIGDESNWVVTQVPEKGTAASTWIIITRDDELASKLTPPRWEPLPAPAARDLWTDDFSNLLRALK